MQNGRIRNVVSFINFSVNRVEGVGNDDPIGFVLKMMELERERKRKTAKDSSKRIKHGRKTNGISKFLQKEFMKQIQYLGVPP